MEPETGVDESPHVLVVDDDPEIRVLLARYLSGQGLRVSTAEDCRSCHRRIQEGGVDLVVLDVMLPDGSGVEVCKEVRAAGNRVPVILLTALRDEVDRVVGLEVGADDYVGKPFSPRELVARIRAVLRRLQDGPLGTAPSSRVYRFDAFTVESATRRVSRADGDVDLTDAEFDLLETLVSRPGRVLSRDQILELTRGRMTESLDRSVDVLVSRLRRKLGDDGPARLIRTVRNGGYLFSAPVRCAHAAR